MNIVIGILCLVLGFVLGSFVITYTTHSQNIGELVVVDEEGKPEPLMFLRINPDTVPKLNNKTLVHLTVYRKNLPNSQN